jgi:glycosyltransferase involved in cell wall biosynthesis
MRILVVTSQFPIAGEPTRGRPIYQTVRELARDAALLVDPTSTEQLTDALKRALTDTAERARLRTAGLARAAEFDRSRTAREALATYRAVLRS